MSQVVAGKQMKMEEQEEQEEQHTLNIDVTRHLKNVKEELK